MEQMPKKKSVYSKEKFDQNKEEILNMGVRVDTGQYIRRIQIFKLALELLICFLIKFFSAYII